MRRLARRVREAASAGVRYVAAWLGFPRARDSGAGLSPEAAAELVKLYPHEYVGPASAFGLEPGPCVIERPWAGGYIIRDVQGRRWTVASRHVRKAPAAAA